MEVLGCVTVVVVTVVVEARTTGTVIDFWRMLGATDCPVLETRITWKNKMIFNLSMSAEAPYSFNNTSVTIAGHDVNFCSDLPRRASEIQFSLALLQLSLALEKLYIIIL